MFCAVALVIAVFLFTPQLLLNSKTLSWAPGLAARIGVSLKWESGSLKTSSETLVRKHFDFSFRGLCVSVEKPSLEGCLEKADLSFTLQSIPWDFRLTEIGPVVVESERFHVALGESAHSEEPKKSPETKKNAGLSLPDIALPSFLKGASFKPITMTVHHLEIAAGKMLFHIAAVLSSVSDAEGRLQEAVLDAQADDIDGFKKPRLKVSLRSASYFEGKDWSLDASLLSEEEKKKTLNMTVLMGQEAPAKESGENGSVSYALQARFAQEALKASLETEGRLEKSVVSGVLRGDARGFSREVSGIRLGACEYRYASPKGLENRGKLSFQGPLHVDLSPLKLPSATFRKIVTLPYNLDFIIETDLETSLLPSLDAPVSGSLKIDLSPITQDLLNLHGRLAADFAGIPSQYPKDWKLLTDVDVALRFPYFRKVVAALEKTAFAVPAPFAVLDGEIELALRGKTDLIQGDGKIPFELRTDLKSAEESLKTEGKGNLSYLYMPNQDANLAQRRNGRFEFDLELTDVAVSLPRFGFAGLPLLFMDKRIRQPQDYLTRKKTTFDYAVHIHTSNPIRVSSNLARDRVPVTVDLNLSPKGVTGTVGIAASTLRVFNQNAELRELKIALKDPQEASEVTGRIHTTYEYYKIDLYILGTLSKPRLVLESVPPLSEDQLLSILMYGQPFEDLDATKSSTVSNTSAAFSQGVVGLGSFLLLASTPIKSVTYDPTTGAFSASLSLGGGTLLKVATQETKQQVGLRKSLSGNWSVNTYLENDKESQKQTGVTFFEWIKRY